MKILKGYAGLIFALKMHPIPISVFPLTFSICLILSTLLSDHRLMDVIYCKFVKTMSQIFL